LQTVSGVISASLEIQNQEILQTTVARTEQTHFGMLRVARDIIERLCVMGIAETGAHEFQSVRFLVFPSFVCAFSR
jgi:hypothetical protein